MSSHFQPRSLRSTLTRALLTAAVSVLVACSTVTPSDANGGGSSANRTPGEPFVENVCFQCTWRMCNVALRACAREAMCSRWFDCVSVCPTDDSGVAAEASCVRKCGLPASAEVLYECIQQHATGALLGCELACAQSDE